MKQKVAAVILGAGKGTRMHSDKPKVLMPVCGKTMVRRIIDTLESIPVDEIVTVISPDGKDVAKEVAPYATCVQELQLGTGHAVNCAKDFLKDFKSSPGSPAIKSRCCFIFLIDISSSTFSLISLKLTNLLILNKTSSLVV